ncbi:MAG: DNA-processing protein DprA, partial [Gammaproteobacteria bacterium]|nr:DNA-processing protein DprA [Gammaproteobacteria bacterium]
MGPVKAHRWLEFFGDVEKIFSASPHELKKARLTPEQIDLVRKPDWAAAEKSLTWALKNHCQLIVFTDDLYPPLLREIHAAPLLFYLRGDTSLLSQPQLAMVGSRHASVMGLSQAKQFASELASRGWVITSGMALGIDAASHR